MSRTRHALPTRQYHMMRVQNRRKAEQSAIDEIDEEGVSPRHPNRLRNYWGIIPEPWNDKRNASGNEYHNKQYWVEFRKAANSPHYTRGDDD